MVVRELQNAAGQEGWGRGGQSGEEVRSSGQTVEDPDPLCQPVQLHSPIRTGCDLSPPPRSSSDPQG